MNTLFSDNTLTNQSNTVNKISKLNKAAIAITFVASTLFSMNASAAQDASIESTISEVLVNQSKQALAEINNQLQLSIEKEIKAMKLSILNNRATSSVPEHNEVSKKVIANVKHQKKHQL